MWKLSHRRVSQPWYTTLILIVLPYINDDIFVKQVELFIVFLDCGTNIVHSFRVFLEDMKLSPKDRSKSKNARNQN